MKWTSGVALASTLLSGGLALAQQAGTAPDPARRPVAERREQEQRGPRERQTNARDAQIATCVAIGNAVEVELAQLASPRLQNEQAKEFAQQMIRDHREMLDKLERFGAENVALRADATPSADATPDARERDGDERVRTQPAGEGRAEADRGDGADRRAERREARGERRADGEIDFLSIKREIAEACVRSAQEELASKSAAEVDRCFLAGQVFMHQHMLDELKVLERHASPEFKETLVQAAQATEAHLQHAKTVLKTVEENHGSEIPATSGTSNR